MARAVFWFNVPLGVIGVVWAIVALRGIRVHPRGGRFALALLAAAISYSRGATRPFRATTRATVESLT